MANIDGPRNFSCGSKVKNPGSALKIHRCGWMDYVRFYVFFNSILVTSGRWDVGNERLCAMELRLRLRNTVMYGHLF